MEKVESGVSVLPAIPEYVAPLPGVRYMEKYVFICRMISMWPRGTISLIRYWTVFLIFFSSSGLTLAGMYYKVLFHAGDVDGAAEVVDFLTVFTSGIYRYLYAYLKGNKYEEIVSFIHDNFIHESFGFGTRKTMDQCIKLTKLIACGYLIVTNIWLIQLSFCPFLVYHLQKNMMYENGTAMYPNAEVIMAVNVTLPTDKYNMGMSYCILILGFYCMTYLYVFGDVFWFVIMILTTGQYELITYSLKSIPNDSEEPEEEELSKIEAVLASSVIQHRLTRELARKMEDLMNPLVLIDFIHAVASISFILFEMTIALYESQWIMIMNLLEYLMISIFHMFVLDYFGNEVYLKEQEISEAAYSIPWYKYPKKLQTQIILLTAVARKPCRLTGGKLYTISLEFFAGTMKTVFSYFMVLLQLLQA